MVGRLRTTARLVARAIVLVAVVAIAAFDACPALADGRVQFLADRLRFPPAAGQPDDFRVRTNAALALGATHDDGAVAPLCGGLEDPSELVRQAVAVALKRLARASSLECLRRRVGVEAIAAVKEKIQRAIEACQGPSVPSGGAGGETYMADARYYVSISPIANNTTRARADIERLVHDAIVARLAELGEYQVAPAGESSEVARSLMARRKLKGFYLAVSVDKLDYSDGNLRVRVKIAVFSYPGKDLRGEVPAGATMPGARPGDSGSEDQLLGVVAAKAAELFAQNFR
jgi:HEAT repeats